MIDKITLINPPSPFLLDQLMMPPLGILYVAAALKKQGIEVELVDLALGDQKIPWSDAYGITANTPQFPFIKQFMDKSPFPNPDAKTCIGGPHATLRPQECLGLGFDAVISGEGECSIFDFLNGSQGIINAPVIPDIDTIPFPDRTLVQDYDYRVDGKWTTTIMTSRGCPFNCAFCCKNWVGVRYRSWQNIVEELEEIKELGYEGIQFEDDAVWYNPKRDLKVFEHLNHLALVWRAPMRADFVTKERVQIMATSGCKEIFIGVETGSDAILTTINKGTTVQQNKDALKTIHEAGMGIKIGIVLGLPGESEKTLKETWSFCEEMEQYITAFGITTLVPYPGSPIHDYPEKFDIQFDKTRTYEPHTGGDCIVSTSFLSNAEISDWRKAFYRRFKGREYA